VPRLTLLFFGAAKVFQKQQKWSPPGQLTYIETGKPMAKRGPLSGLRQQRVKGRDGTLKTLCRV
jgi:hypothetical protein